MGEYSKRLAEVCESVGDAIGGSVCVIQVKQTGKARVIVDMGHILCKWEFDPDQAGVKAWWKVVGESAADHHSKFDWGTAAHLRRLYQVLRDRAERHPTHV